MEADCQDTKMECPSDPPDLMQQLFTSLTTHILLQTDRIQKQIQQNDAKLTAAQDMFKKEVRNELDAFRALLAMQISVIRNQIPRWSGINSQVIARNLGVGIWVSWPISLYLHGLFFMIQ